MDRNQRMVDVAAGATAICLAFPDEEETLRSGTWATVRRARRVGMKIVATNIALG